METFQREISFLSKQLNEQNEFKLEVTKKAVTFSELDPTNREQHKLHFMVPQFFEKATYEDDKVSFDTSRTYEMASMFIDKMLVLDDTFTSTDKVELLNDSIAIWAFGRWLVGAKIIPFFYLFSERLKQ